MTQAAVSEPLIRSDPYSHFPFPPSFCVILYIPRQDHCKEDSLFFGVAPTRAWASGILCGAAAGEELVMEKRWNSRRHHHLPILCFGTSHLSSKLQNLWSLQQLLLSQNCQNQSFHREEALFYYEEVSEQDAL
ncbi:hypothetical protein HPB51_029336 [Rhipicephalus microplus]|uniref:Uncharacterized protein n=1 Tax=Rhipicephalus microplus TaxID=6941 RepID=A0A9J6CUL3_RHIMP|nr:hypothetical protein HPB51_029336 [Rhipicephalus microplus]